MPSGAGGYAGRRPVRRPARGRREQEDAVVSALAVQVVIVLLLLLAAYLLKKAAPESYQKVRGQYDIMVTDPGQNQQVLGLLTGGEEGSESLAEAVDSFFARLAWQIFGGGERENENIESEVFPEEVPARPTFQYDYLGDYATLGGQGGMEPATSGEVPAVATMTPVILSAYLQPPVTGPITSPFSYREHPITGDDDFHTGVDIAAEEGRPILSALPGTVEEVGESDIYGNYIVLRHGDNLQTSYSHCSQIIAREGMVLRQGERIARVGETGTATGPHLHFSVLVDGVYTDPYWVLKGNIQLVE